MVLRSVAGRVAYDAFGVRPQSYEHLIAVASRYARRHFDGRTVVNRQTDLPIELD
ncbi:MAG TPA: hypothetical protein VMF12_19470 [Xanthobacteraceae bacterium]|nr:hypothetical protein [Xanthobacteraceae bacterium]HUC64595.1 hypothetical protein [Stellaceae bacterium]